MKIKGYICAILASVMWGTVFLVGRFTMGGGEVNPFVLAFWRCFFATAFLSCILRGRIKDAFTISGKEYIILLFLAFTGIFLFNVLIFASLKFTTATSSSILMNANPLFILILAAVFLREKMNMGKIISVITGFAGCIMVIKGTYTGYTGVINPLKGNLLALGSALCWALYTVFGGGPVKKYGAVLTTFITISFGMLMLLFMMFLMRINFWDIGRSVFLAGAYLGIVPAGIGFTLWYNALKYIDAGELGIFRYLASVVTAILAVIFLKESLNVLMLVGMSLVFLSLYLPKIQKE